MTIETKRLVLRPVTPGDRAALHEMFTQPGVRRFLFDDRLIAPGQTAEIIQKSEAQFRTERAGLWLAERRDEIIGFGAFWYFRDPPELELLYGVADAHLKRGYGREIAHAIVNYGTTILRMDIIRGSTDAAHAESRRLLDDLGFRFDRQVVVEGIDTAFYSKSTKDTKDTKKI